jgi:hypothetical protein
MHNTLEYLIAYLLVGVITSVGTSLWFVKGTKVYGVIGFFLINLFFYPFTLALWVQDSVFGYKHNIKCAWCGEAVDFNDPEQAQEHVKHCQKHPTLTKIAKLQKEITKLKTEKLWDVPMKYVSNVDETIRLRQLVRDLKEDGDRLDDWCDHSDECHVFRGGMNGDAVCDCGYEEMHILHVTLMEKIDGVINGRH